MDAQPPSPRRPPLRSALLSRLRAELDAVGRDLRTASRGRRATLALLAAAILWLGFHGLHESLWSYRYWKVDPWALESPVQWPVVGRHARALDDLAERLGPCLEPAETVAVSTPEHWPGQDHYAYMWLAYALPEHDLRPVASLEDASSEGRPADLYLDYFGDGEPSPPPGLTRLCATDRAAVYGREPVP